MTLRNLTPTLLIVSVAALSLVAGCSKKTDSAKKTGAPEKAVDPHDVPMTDAEKKQLKEEVATYDKALAHIKEFRDTIKKETTEGTPAKAHRALDKLDLVLEWLGEIAKTSNVPKDQWGTIGSNAQKLRELFNKVHANIDAGKAPDYEAVGADIDTSVSALEAVKTK